MRHVGQEPGLAPLAHLAEPLAWRVGEADDEIVDELYDAQCPDAQVQEGDQGLFRSPREDKGARASRSPTAGIALAEAMKAKAAAATSSPDPRFR